MNTACPKCGFAYGWDGIKCSHCKHSVSGVATAREELVRFLCPGCGKRMKAPVKAAGRIGTCRKCSTRTLIPQPTRAAPALVLPTPPAPAATRSPAVPTVPVKATVPSVEGTIETQVSHPLPDWLAPTTVAGVLVGGAILGSGRAGGAIPPPEQAFLRDAACYLDNPSFLIWLAGCLGQTLETLLQRGVPQKVMKIVNIALRKTMSLAADTIRPIPAADLERDLATSDKAASWTGLWHKVAVAGSGAAGGFIGLPALAIELPVTTGILFRSIASIAADFGEDLRDPSVRLQCFSVFSYSGVARGGDPKESSYLKARVVMAELIKQAAQVVAGQSADALARGTAPALMNLIAWVADQFALEVSEKFLAQSVPVVGGIAGAAINVAFAHHFNKVARFHFGIRKLERQYGKELVQGTFLGLRQQDGKTLGYSPDKDAEPARGSKDS